MGNMRPDTLKAAEDMLLHDEGLKRRPYKCPAGFWTWGVGHNLEATPLPLDILILILNGEMQAAPIDLLRHDILQTELAAQRVLGIAVYNGLSEPRKLAVVNMVFNLGEAGFAKFVSTIAAIQRGDFKAAGEHAAASLWARQVGTWGANGQLVGGRAYRVIKLLVHEESVY